MLVVNHLTKSQIAEEREKGNVVSKELDCYLIFRNKEDYKLYKRI
jgi:hypothetical protein